MSDAADPELSEQQLAEAVAEEVILAEPPPPHKPYPGFWQAIWPLTQFVLYLIVFIIPFAIVDAIWKTHPTLHPSTSAAASVAAAVVSMWRVCVQRQTTLRLIAGPLPSSVILPARRLGRETLPKITGRAIGLWPYPVMVGSFSVCLCDRRTGGGNAFPWHYSQGLQRALWNIAGDFVQRPALRKHAFLCA